MKRIIVRLILSAVLLYAVYTETGIWTTITIGLLMIATELSGLYLRYLKRLKDGD